MDRGAIPALAMVRIVMRAAMTHGQLAAQLQTPARHVGGRPFHATGNDEDRALTAHPGYADPSVREAQAPGPPSARTLASDTAGPAKYPGNWGLVVASGALLVTQALGDRVQ